MVDISARITPGHLEQLRRSFRGEIVTPDGPALLMIRDRP